MTDAFGEIHLELVLIKLTHHYLLDTRTLLFSSAHGASAWMIRVRLTLNGILEADLTCFARAGDLLRAALHLLPFQIFDKVSLAGLRLGLGNLVRVFSYRFGRRVLLFHDHVRHGASFDIFLRLELRDRWLPGDRRSFTTSHKLQLVG